MKILILEDEKTIRNALRFALQKEGHDVTESENPYEAQQLILQQTFDLLIIDFMLPHLSGLEFLELLNEQPQLKPVVVLTSHPSIAGPLFNAEQFGNIEIEIISKDLPLKTIIERIQHLLTLFYTK